MSNTSKEKKRRFQTGLNTEKKTETKPEQNPKMEEKVMVFPADIMTGKDWMPKSGHGFTHNALYIQNAIDDIFDGEELAYMRRGDVEEDESFKQLIPYVVLKQGRQIFRYQRSKGGGEARLHDKWSIGVGGHVNPIDNSEPGKDAYLKALAREIKEEVGVTLDNLSADMGLCGLIYDDSNEVGRVHVGLVHIITIPNGVKLTLENSMCHGEFRHITDFRKSLKSDNYENWSRIAIENLL